MLDSREVQLTSSCDCKAEVPSTVIPKLQSSPPVIARIQNRLFRVSPVPNQNLNFTIMSPELWFTPWACDGDDLSRDARGTPWGEARIRGTEMTHQVVKGSDCAKCRLNPCVHSTTFTKPLNASRTNMRNRLTASRK